MPKDLPMCLWTECAVSSAAGCPVGFSAAVFSWVRGVPPPKSSARGLLFWLFSSICQISCAGVVMSVPLLVVSDAV